MSEQRERWDSNAQHDPRGFSFKRWEVGAHDGPGWYYWDTDYPDEGSVGAFESKEECVAHASEAYPEGDDE
jgi:hypothetical protein